MNLTENTIFITGGEWAQSAMAEAVRSEPSVTAARLRLLGAD
jgi:hypothetical protein